MTISRFQEGSERKRKVHSKSRKGCGNCKLRRVKCDETRPQCNKCVSYGVSCNFDKKQSSLDLSAQGSFQVDLSHKPQTANLKQGPQIEPVSVNQTIASIVYDCLSNDTAAPFGNGKQFWVFDDRDLEILKRFQDRTVMTIGTRRTAGAYRDCMIQLAFAHPFLMHIVLSLTLMHDAHLSSDAIMSMRFKTMSLKHWNTGNVLFQRILSRPIEPSSRDALWATAALTGALVFSYVENTDMEQSWPLKSPDPHDLDWLKLSDGKKAIWHLTDPLRPDSMFKILVQEHEHLHVPGWVEENDLSLLPKETRRLFNITPSSTVQNNPYHLPALILSRLQDMNPTHDNILNFLYFMGHMSPEFRTLLETKDPRALLLLAWWFKRLETGELWWLKGRASVEGMAIQVWLQRWYGGEQGLTEMFERIGRWDNREDGWGSREESAEAESPLTGWFGRGAFEGTLWGNCTPQ
ncbi:uncharacterized protein BDR25DRAFT_275020 [Lindgomyces ingoldianus]|uniref:Uncharacterized protein n=1 Tax=Lindgomyces ingoldianus TaxID=673940 RepID=A0ACB6RER8_9PLEO|nr:uncharacterized protein BDR25DRAFT_275020 [Lindgomyces ingoldianus]KAF2477691.1 hypothetical protein BDR25DRAFT_275020 [Lindgomyces ingoldianus]